MAWGYHTPTPPQCIVPMLEQLNNVGLSRVLNLNDYTSCGTGPRWYPMSKPIFYFNKLKK